MSTAIGGQSPFGMNLSFGVGDSEENVRKNRELFFGSLGIQPAELAIPRQVHSSVAKVANSPGSYPDCDALVTASRRVFLCVSVADCVPVFVYDSQNHAVAAMHAGWRGTAGGIVTQTINLMRREYGTQPSKCVAFIGPAASVCCYAVGGEVASQFAGQFVVHRNGGIFVDLKSANARQLEECGISPGAIETSPLCTISEPFLHSYRREKGNSGRMMGTIGIL
ncbi:MAG: peptidoglycan editing factor PgeF [Bacteroidetes bacterium]|nr:peptidoglycan editing factor PgeF [Bacteroidota bacterium]MCW5894342.1 peptidoglycan editing factor PgeF [Bacteroidota bacterium]